MNNFEAELEKPRQSGKQISDPRVWKRWQDLFNKLKRMTDDVNGEYEQDRYWRAVHAKLNEVFDLAGEWQRTISPPFGDAE